jgi:hypothetical protein
MQSDLFPRFFRLKQTFPAPCVQDVEAEVEQAIGNLNLEQRTKPGQSIAITVGSRGIHGVDRIVRACVQRCRQAGLEPFLVPAMGSHGGATAEGQRRLIEGFGVTEQAMGCPIRSSMETVVVATADEGFPVHFDRHAAEADHVLVVNRIKPHTRFTGTIESGLMKMMLIGLGKHQGALVYHRVIMNYSFDQIVRSVARKVIDRCKILGGLAILENADEQTAQIVGVPASEIEATEPRLLQQVKDWMPRLPFDHAELLIVDRIGKDLSGTGMDTNVIGRKANDHAALGDETPKIHLIYVRGLTEATHGNATGIGIAELVHRRVLDGMDVESTRVNCATAGHITAAMIPLDFPDDRSALQMAMSQTGWGEPKDVPILWIPNTLQLSQVLCSEVYWKTARELSHVEVLGEPKPLQWTSSGDLQEMFPEARR